MRAMLIGGEWKKSDKTFDVINPYDNTTFQTIASASIKDLEAAIESAETGAKKNRNTPAYKRSGILYKTSILLEERKREFAETITSESGKAITYSLSEVGRSAQTFRFAAEEAKRREGKTVPMDAVAGSENRMGFYQEFPVGVIAAITPFNFPLNLVAHKVAPAIAAGNSIVLKPSPLTPVTALLLGDVLLEAGLPPDVLNIVTSDSDAIGRNLVTHDAIDMISFTGSCAVGKTIKESSGLKKIALELGSNSACIIEPDADLETAASICATGAFAYGGQICISLQRIYVQKEIFRKFADIFLSVVEKIKTGNPMDVEIEYGPLISPKETERCLSWVQEATASGAKLLAGGLISDTIMTPTVFQDVQSSMKIVKNEVFGPIVSLIPYETTEEAIEMVNDSDYGLQAGMFTKDIQKAFYAFRNIHTGGVLINDGPTYRADHMPYGGVKKSGLGREGVQYAMTEMSEKRMMLFNL